MKFRTSRDTLLRPLRVVTGVVERRQTLPVLSNLLVQATESGLTLRGTDLEVEVVAELTEGVTVEQTGATTLPAHKLADIWQSLPESAEVSVAFEGERTVVRSGRSRFTLAVIPATEFPSARPLDEAAGASDAQADGDSNDVEVTLSRQSLRHLLDRTKFAMANQDVRYFLNGLLVEVNTVNNERTVRAAASDGYRMAMCTLTERGVEGVEELRVIVPRKSITDLERLIADSDEDVTLKIGKTSLRASQGEYTLTTKLVDGQFPQVDRLVPRNIDHSFTSDRDSLRQALRRAAILSNERSQDVLLQISGDQLTVRASNPEQEEAEETVPVEYDGDPTEIGFNVRFVLDVLEALDTDSVKLSMPEGNTIAVVEAPGAEDSLYLVMPMRR